MRTGKTIFPAIAIGPGVVISARVFRDFPKNVLTEESQEEIITPFILFVRLFTRIRTMGIEAVFARMPRPGRTLVDFLTSEFG